MSAATVRFPKPGGETQSDSRVRTESRLAIQFAKAHAHELCFDHARRAWFLFDGHLWRQDRNGAALRKLQRFVEKQMVRALRAADEHQRETKFLIHQLTAAQLPRLLALAANQEGLAVDGSHWDTDPMLLGTRNGVIDLRTGTWRPGAPGDYITRSVGWDYILHAQCPRFERFLSEVATDEATHEFLLLTIGYVLTGLTREQCMFVFHGLGANGKSTLLEVLRLLLGDYATTIAFSSLTSGRNHGGEQPHSDLAGLRGTRLVIASEVGEGMRLDEGRLKSITGGDSISCRFLYGRWFEYVPEFKLVWVVNHRPRVSDDSMAFWRRVRLVPFRAQFSGPSRDNGLLDTLRSEMPGILNLAIAGCLAWQANGLAPTVEMSAEAEDWRRENDPLAEFLTSDLVLTESEGRASSGRLYQQYLLWAEREGLGIGERLSHRAFGTRLKARFESTKPGGVVTYHGIAVRERSALAP